MSSLCVGCRKHAWQVAAARIDEKKEDVALQKVFEVHVRREMSFGIACAASRDVTVAVVSEILKVRPVNKRNAGIRASQGLAALLCGFLEPSLLDESFEALEGGVQVDPVGEDLVGESGCKGANLM